MKPSEILRAMKPVANTFERLYVEGGDLTGWLCWLLEGLEGNMEKPEFETELRKLAAALDERLLTGRW
jgi:hypothetical protein